MVVDYQFIAIILGVGLILIDTLYGWVWARKSAKVFDALANYFLDRALVEEYHRNLKVYLSRLNRCVGKFLPNNRVAGSLFLLFFFAWFLGVLIESINKQVPFSNSWATMGVIYSLAATLTSVFSYSFTYFVLSFISQQNNFSWLLLLYVTILDIVVAYVLCPMAYIAILLYNYCSDCSILIGIEAVSVVISSWPVSIIGVSVDSAVDFQSRINAALLWFAMVFTVLPTAVHLTILLFDFVRGVMKILSLGLMELFAIMANIKRPFAWVGGVVLSGVGIAYENF